MDAILTDILFALARSAVATVLSRELYSVTVPGLLLFSLSVYAVITRDPLRNSLPPSMEFVDASSVLSGVRRAGRDKRELVRLSVFGRDCFWLSREDVMEGLVDSREVVPVYYGKGMVVSVGEKDQKAIETVFTSANLAMFNDVLGEELEFFVGKVSKAQGIVRGVVQEFISRTLQRIVYGMGPKEKFNKEIVTSGNNFREVLLHHYFPLLEKLQNNKEEVNQRKSISNVLCLESQMQKLDVGNPTILSNYIVTSHSPLIAAALHQALQGLLLDLKIVQQAQFELGTLVPSKSHLLIEDTKELLALPAIVAESLRLSVLSESLEVLYQTTNDIWYKRWFLPKDSIIVFDGREISSRYDDDEFRPERFLDKMVSIEEVEDTVFKYGLYQKNMVKMILFNTLATVLRKFNVERNSSDGKLKYVPVTVKLEDTKSL